MGEGYGYTGGVNYCATHRNVETGLSCVRCGKFICPKCLTHTSVGSRCRDCARTPKVPVFDVSARQYALAVGAAVVMAAVGGVAWAVLDDAAGRFFFVSWLLAFGAGYVIGESVSRASSRKRGPGLVTIAVAAATAAYLVVVFSTWDRPGGGIRVDVLDIGFAVLHWGLAAFTAAGRIR